MIYGPIISTDHVPDELSRWLDKNLTQGIDYNWELDKDGWEWQLFFYNNPENITAFKLRFGV